MKLIKNSFLSALALLVFGSMINAQWQKQAVNTNASLRGLSVVNEKIIWASGSNGTFLKTVDGGKNWTTGKVPDAEKLDFRDVEAFDANTAYLLSIGNGDSSRIYKTIDGGAMWKLQFKNTNPKVFLDAFAFWDAAHGIAMGDPVDDKFYLLGTGDGENWQPLSTDFMPPAQSGEAAFAASGTCIITTGESDVWMVTGGKVARVFHSKNRGSGWLISPTQLTNHSDGSGIFSIAFHTNQNGVIVGGDYKKPEEAARNLAFSTDGGKFWRDASGLNGYRSGVAFVDEKTLIAVGSSGSDLSTDGGKTWKNLDKENYNAVQAKGKNAVWAVGANGLVSRFSVK